MDEVEESCQLLREVAAAEVLWSHEVAGNINFRIERYLCKEGKRILPPMPCPAVGVQFGGKKVLAQEAPGPSVQGAISIPSVTLVIPGNSESYWEVSGLLDFVMIYFRGAAQQKYRALIADLHYPLALNDTLTGVVAKQLVTLLATEVVESGKTGQRQAHLQALGDTLFYQVCYLLAHPYEHRDLDTVSGRYPYVYDVVAYIRENLGSPLTIEKLATRAGLKQSHFREIFKRVTGLSPHFYVTNARLERAHELLANTDMPIVVLADDLGFSSQSHLTSAFKKHYGMTPAQFRRQKTSRA